MYQEGVNASLKAEESVIKEQRRRLEREGGRGFWLSLVRFCRHVCAIEAGRRERWAKRIGPRSADDIDVVDVSSVIGGLWVLVFPEKEENV